MGIFDKFKKQTPPAASNPARNSNRTKAAEPNADESRREPAKPSGRFRPAEAGSEENPQILFTDVRDLFKKEGRLVDDAFLEELRASLIKTDMGPAAAEQIVAQIGADFRARVVQMADVLDIVRRQLKELMAQDAAPLRVAAEGPTVIMIAGVNGSGKTTSIAKLTKYFTFAGKARRAGRRRHVSRRGGRAIERMGRPARRGDRHRGRRAAIRPASRIGQSPRAVEQRADVCIIDTAGRLQTQQNLMSELTKIQRVIAQKNSGSAARSACWCSTPPAARTASARRADSRRPCNAPASSWQSSTARRKGASSCRFGNSSACR